MAAPRGAAEGLGEPRAEEQISSGAGGRALLFGATRGMYRCAEALGEQRRFESRKRFESGGFKSV